MRPRAERRPPVRTAPQYSAQSTRVLAAEYSSTVRQVLSRHPEHHFPASGSDESAAKSLTLRQSTSAMDIWDKKKRSAVMAKIKSKDTKPEWIVRRYLFSRGYRYRKNVKGMPGTPDIVMRKYGIVIFIHGCFWHGHTDGHLPHSNVDFWREKIERNKQRDARNKAELKRMGWRVMTIWECQLKPAVRRQTLLEMEYFINHTYLERFRPRRPSVAYAPDHQEAPARAAEDDMAYRTRTEVTQK